MQKYNLPAKLFQTLTGVGFYLQGGN